VTGNKSGHGRGPVLLNGMVSAVDTSIPCNCVIGVYGDRGYRPTLNSYQFGEAWSLAKIASSLNQPGLAQSLAKIAIDLKQKVEETLWDPTDSFFKVLPYKNKTSSLVSVRELIGYTPWYFNLPSSDKLVAWRLLTDAINGFNAPYGLTTAEQRHPQFELDYDSKHECLWNGPVWPYATSMTLTAFANAFNIYGSLLLQHVSREAFLDLVKTYAASHNIYCDKTSKNISWIDENINPYTGAYRIDGEYVCSQFIPLSLLNVHDYSFG
jgi:hypothetical protein